ncbi:MAG TPA: hypothetical protein VHT27_10575 [Solirubrobacteraceae bacterium]|jgi:hypothetical protein|nr:hypothetical protein [Solirubrobacteraceae bacterium]
MDDQHGNSTDQPIQAAVESSLTIRQTATGYWTVQRAGRDVAGSMTRRGAEAERDLVLRLGRRTVRRTAARA